MPKRIILEANEAKPRGADSLPEPQTHAESSALALHRTATRTCPLGSTSSNPTPAPRKDNTEGSQNSPFGFVSSYTMLRMLGEDIECKVEGWRERKKERERLIMFLSP